MAAAMGGGYRAHTPNQAGQRPEPMGAKAYGYQGAVQNQNVAGAKYHYRNPSSNLGAVRPSPRPAQYEPSKYEEYKK